MAPADKLCLVERIWDDLAAEATPLPLPDWALTEAARRRDELPHSERHTKRFGSALTIHAMARSIRYHPLFESDVLNAAEWYGV